MGHEPEHANPITHGTPTVAGEVFDAAHPEGSTAQAVDPLSPAHRFGPGIPAPDDEHATVPQEPASPPFSRAGMLLNTLLAIVAGAGGAWGYARFVKSPETPPAAQVLGAVPKDAEHRPPPPPPPAVTQEAFNDLSKKVDHLCDRFDRLQERFASMPKPEPAPDMAALGNQIIAQVKGDPQMSALPGRLSVLTDRINALEKTEASIKVQVDSFSKPGARNGNGNGNGSSGTGHAAADPGLTPAGSREVDAAIDQGAELFRRANYREALGHFNRLEHAYPQDARVWYYAALTTGLATNRWDGDAERLVNKGVELERAGTPDAAKIDSAFAGLTVNTGRDWLAGYRRHVR